MAKYLANDGLGRGPHGARFGGERFSRNEKLTVLPRGSLRTSTEQIPEKKRN